MFTTSLNPHSADTRKPGFPCMQPRLRRHVCILKPVVFSGLTFVVVVVLVLVVAVNQTDDALVDYLFFHVDAVVVAVDVDVA